MRRAWVMLSVSLALVAVAGCGKKSYEDRLARTLEELKEKRRQDTNLMAPPTEKKFTDLAIYLRAPKEESQAKTFQLPVTEGQFDLEASFNDAKADSSLHVLARVKMPKKAAAKGAPPPPPPAARGEFVGDVLGVLANVFGGAEGLQAPKFVEESKKGNRFRRLIFSTPDKEVKLYTYKQGSHEVALAFVYGPSLRNAMATKIELCLETFAVGQKATLRYTGGAPEEEAETSGPAPL